ncbi:YwpF family protein [Aquibacillus kalidii]|uniref:YwpF family protein n=1 Tax=Aquibacillus kalidii TaxID=2762597 RepID=UPI0016474659|nr:YwpF family protein [Aquibacillus kalidii]
MKTFRLISLEILEDDKDQLISHNIPLLDGLILNREEETSQWILECLIDRRYWLFFSDLKESKEELMLQAKITKETNQPATFMSSIIEINDINEGTINVLFAGKLIDRKKDHIEETLKRLIEEGYQGERLLAKFKEAEN